MRILAKKARISYSIIFAKKIDGVFPFKEICLGKRCQTKKKQKNCDPSFIDVFSTDLSKSLGAMLKENSPHLSLINPFLPMILFFLMTPLLFPVQF